MVCPKCNEGVIVKIKFKKTGRIAYLCDFCESMWFEGETMDLTTGHSFEAYKETEGSEYSVTELSEKSQEYQPAQDPEDE